MSNDFKLQLQARIDFTYCIILLSKEAINSSLEKISTMLSDGETEGEEMLAEVRKLLKYVEKLTEEEYTIRVSKRKLDQINNE